MKKLLVLGLAFLLTTMAFALTSTTGKLMNAQTTAITAPYDVGTAQTALLPAMDFTLVALAQADIALASTDTTKTSILTAQTDMAMIGSGTAQKVMTATTTGLPFRGAASMAISTADIRGPAAYLASTATKTSQHVEMATLTHLMGATTC